jgi:hypothetical protein
MAMMQLTMLMSMSNNLHDALIHEFQPLVLFQFTGLRLERNIHQRLVCVFQSISCVCLRAINRGNELLVRITQKNLVGYLAPRRRVDAIYKAVSFRANSDA